jgi:hypothetical protein
MGISLIILGISVFGFAVLWLRHVSDVVSLSDEELLFVKNTRPSFTRQIFGFLPDFLHNSWFSSVRPMFYKLLMGLVGFLQKIFISFAHACTRLTSRLRARSATVPKPSQYWQEIYSWKSIGKSRLKGLRTPYRKMNKQRDIREIITTSTRAKSEATKEDSNSQVS